MSIELAERLKQEWTDQYVVVQPGIPELRRFSGRTGQVKTVNMNGYALVEFDSSEDISWYDIDTSYLDRVDKPDPAAKKAASEEKPAKEDKAAKPPAAAKPAGGMSALEMARAQAAGGGAAQAAPAAEKKALSPLELARQQGAGTAPAPAATPDPQPAAEPEPAAEVEEAAPAAEAAPAPSGGAVALSTDEILKLAREQDQGS